MMKRLISVFFGGRFTKLSLLVYVSLNLLAGFMVINANGRLADLFHSHLMTLSTEGFLVPLLITVGLFIVIFLIGLLGEYILNGFRWKGEERLKRYCIEKLMSVECKYYNDKQPAGMWSELNISTQQSANLFSGVVATVSVTIMMLFYGSVLFMVDFYAGLFTVAVTPVYMLLSLGLGRKFEQLQMGVMSHHRDMGATVIESLSGIPNIKAKNAYGFFVNRVLAVQAKITRGMRKISVLNYYLFNVMNVTNIIAPLLILVAATRFSTDLRLDVSNVLILYINIPLFMARFSGIYGQYMQYRSSKPGLKIILALQAVPDEKSGDIKITNFESLETKNTVVRFGENRTITLPDLVIKKGEKVMLSGESGVGKSTLFNIVLGFVRDYEGDVFINGINLRSVDLHSLRKVIGIAFQSAQILTLPLRENIMLDLPKPEDEIQSVIKTTHLESLSEKNKDIPLHNQTLSGGEKSRITLAQALIREPDMLMIDESFSNVDETMEAQIIERIFEKYPDKTFLCISHRMVSKKYFNRTITF
jgi:ABC-type bacteriocin/lantibiotic exporter with double-glycine peptidase domain